MHQTIAIGSENLFVLCHFVLIRVFRLFHETSHEVDCAANCLRLHLDECLARHHIQEHRKKISVVADLDLRGRNVED